MLVVVKNGNNELCLKSVYLSNILITRQKSDKPYPL